MVGGLSYFQVFVSITMYVGFMTGGMIVYGLEYLTIYPEYECLIGDEW